MNKLELISKEYEKIKRRNKYDIGVEVDKLKVLQLCPNIHE